MSRREASRGARRESVAARTPLPADRSWPPCRSPPARRQRLLPPLGAVDGAFEANSTPGQWGWGGPRSDVATPITVHVYVSDGSPEPASQPRRPSIGRRRCPGPPPPRVYVTSRRGPRSVRNGSRVGRTPNALLAFRAVRGGPAINAGAGPYRARSLTAGAPEREPTRSRRRCLDEAAAPTANVDGQLCGRVRRGGRAGQGRQPACVNMDRGRRRAQNKKTGGPSTCASTPPGTSASTAEERVGGVARRLKRPGSTRPRPDGGLVTSTQSRSA